MSEKKLKGILWGLNAILALLFIVPLSEISAIFQFVGRLHPLILHFPIVLLIAGFIFEILDGRNSKNDYAQSAALLLWAGAFTAVVSAIAGLLLSTNGEYSGDIFLFHKWFGLATSLIAALLIAIRQRTGLKKSFIPVYGLLMITLIITGHFGASLTHGEDFLTEVFEENEPLALIPQSPIFDQVVTPILDSKCTSCHNPNKLKGGLLLDSKEGIEKGGESGVVIISGDIQKSLLTHHVLLPKDNDDHMPPKGKLQLTNAEVKMISWWVENGASFSQPVAAIEVNDPIQAILAEYFSPTEKIDIEFASAQLIASLSSDKISIDQLSADLPYLNVFIGHNEELSSDDLKGLSKVRKQVYSLDLGNSRIEKSILKEVSKFKNLHRLYLDNTALDDDILGSLGKLKSLEYLNLYGTEVTQKGLSKVLKLPKLNQLFLWQTGIDERGLQTLQQQNPTIDINGGLSPDSEFTKAQLSAPVLDFASSFFEDRMTVEVTYGLSDTEMIYQLDDEAPQTLMNGTIEIDRSAKLRVIAKKEGWEDSEPIEQAFIKVAKNKFKHATLKHDPKGDYTGNGIKTLFDLSKGTEDFRDGRWLGFNGDDLVLDIELTERKNLNSIYVSTMEDLGSWIFPTLEIEIWGATGSEKLTKLNALKFNKPEGPEPKQMKIHQLKFPTTIVSKLQIRVKNYGTLPDWHPGKGNTGWLFIDEIAFE